MRRVSWMRGAGTVGETGADALGAQVYRGDLHEAEKEPGTLLVQALILIAAGLGAALLPAHWVASIGPMQALHSKQV